MLQLAAAQRQGRYDAVVRRRVLGPRLLITGENWLLAVHRRLGQPFLPYRFQAI